MRSYVVDESGSIVKMTIAAGEAGAGTYLVEWNGHGDALGLWRLESDGTLTMANTYTYGTWGTPTTWTWNGIPNLGFRFLYVGEYDVQWDNLALSATTGPGLYYMHARHYSPGLGRFLQPDPDGSEANLYGYVADRPVSGTDPDGSCFILCLVVVPIVLFGGLGAASGAANYALTTPRDSWSAEGVTGAAVSSGVNAALMGTPIPFGRVGTVAARVVAGSSAGTWALRSAARANFLPSAVQRFGGHAVARMGQKNVTNSMVDATIRNGIRYWDPNSRAVSYLLRSGMASGKSILVGRNPITGKITTVIVGTYRKVYRSRFELLP